MFQEQPATWGKGLPRGGDELANAEQAFTATVECKPGFMVAHDGIKALQLIVGDVRRIAEHEIQPTPPGTKWFPPAAAMKATF